MRRTKLLAAALAGALVLVMAAGCGEADKEQGGENGTQSSAHTHTFAEQWSYDSQYHWHFASCGHQTMAEGLERHTFENGGCKTCGYFSKDGIDISSFVSEKVSKEEWENALSGESLKNFKMYGASVESGTTIESSYEQYGDDLHIESSMSGTTRKQELIITFRGDEVDTYFAEMRGTQQEPQWEHISGSFDEFMEDGTYFSACCNIFLKEIAKHFDRAKLDEAHGEYVISSKDMGVNWGFDFHLKFQNGKLRGLYGPMPYWMVVYGYGEAEEIVPPAGE